MFIKFKGFILRDTSTTLKCLNQYSQILFIFFLLDIMSNFEAQFNNIRYLITYILLYLKKKVQMNNIVILSKKL